jgi:hypothetical protein
MCRNNFPNCIEARSRSSFPKLRWSRQSVGCVLVVGLSCACVPAWLHNARDGVDAFQEELARIDLFRCVFYTYMYVCMYVCMYACMNESVYNVTPSAYTVTSYPRIPVVTRRGGGTLIRILIILRRGHVYTFNNAIWSYIKCMHRISYILSVYIICGRIVNPSRKQWFCVCNN